MCIAIQSFCVSFVGHYLQGISKCHHGIQVKALTHRTKVKELALTKADRCVALRRLGQKVALKHTAKTTADGQLARTLCASLPTSRWR